MNMGSQKVEGLELQLLALGKLPLLATRYSDCGTMRDSFETPIYVETYAYRM